MNTNLRHSTLHGLYNERRQYRLAALGVFVLDLLFFAVGTSLGLLGLALIVFCLAKSYGFSQRIAAVETAQLLRSDAT